MAKLYAEIAKMVSTHSRPKAAGACSFGLSDSSSFQHTAARRRLVWPICTANTVQMFQHTAARRRLGGCFCIRPFLKTVSTHSRPKAAGVLEPFGAEVEKFQHTAARRRLVPANLPVNPPTHVSTHSRPKAAGCGFRFGKKGQKSFNTQPPEGGWFVLYIYFAVVVYVSTHSRPKAAGHLDRMSLILKLFQHTAARRRLGRSIQRSRQGSCLFQHTAARRRLGQNVEGPSIRLAVSTHSRPKAAGPRGRLPR